ncbi:MAG: hypothetical protein II240_04140, partial [Bacteroidaceae bacterium]|nr:hypothetical protein [Bacteroidaceae bacterium]
MRKKLKRLLAMVMVVSMTMSLLSGMASAAEKTSDIQIVEQGGKIYYLADPQEGDVAGEDNFDVWTSKTIAGTENEDEFEVTLQVGTTMKAIPNDVAVVLVMDTSGSMMWDENGNKWEDGNVPEGTKLRIEYAREAALEFAEAFATGAGSAKRMMSVVEFGNSAYAPLQWTDANDNGTLNEGVAEAIEAVDVNFKYDEGVSFWDREQAEKDFPGKTACWDGRTYDPEMKNHFEDCYQSYFKSYMTNYFDSYLETKTVEQEIEGGGTETVEVSECTYGECSLTEPHTHCAYEGCKVAEDHKHCSVDGAMEQHSHCDYPECTVNEDQDHKHCAYEGCDLSGVHAHCMYEGCAIPDAHTHCDECGATAEHTHIVGCTLSGCTDTTPDHVHYCVYGGHATYAPYYKGYRCLRTDPNHTHEMYDGDSCRTMENRYEQKFRAIGTNMEGGLLLARNLVNAGQATGGAIEGIDDVYVIILTDGNPTFYTDSTSTTETEFVVGLAGGFSKSNWTDVVDIVSNEVADGETDTALAEDIKAVADLYAILYGTSMEQKLGGDSHVLSNVTGATWFKTKGTNYVGADAVFDSPEAGGLNTVFADIKDRIDVLAKAWVVTDEMGGIELGDDVTFEEFTLNGEYAAATPATNSKNTTISWSLGAMEPESGNGSMADPYIYTLKYKVTLNSAKDNVKATSLAYDARTSNEAVWTNNGASLQYF